MNDHPSPSPGRQRWPLLTALLVLGGLYCALAFLYLPANFYWSADDGLNRIQTDNIRLTPWPDFSITYIGREIDPELKFAPIGQMFQYRQAGRLYLAQSPVIALLSLPFIHLLGDPGRYVMPIAGGLLTAYAAGRLARKLGFGPDWLAALLVGLAAQPETNEQQRNVQDVLVLLLGYLTLVILAGGILTLQGPPVSPAWGAEYYLVAFALGAPLTFFTLHQLWRGRRESWAVLTHLAAAGTLCIVSLGLIFVGVRQFHNVSPSTFHWYTAVEDIPDRYLVTDWEDLALLDPVLFLTRAVFFVENDEALREWVSNAYDQGVTIFAYATFSQIKESTLEFIAPPAARMAVIEGQQLDNGLYILRFQIVPIGLAPAR